MIKKQSKLHRCWQARALRWMCVFGALAVGGCALPRRDAPPTLFSAAAPVDFPGDVRYLSADRPSVEAKSTAALQRLRTSSQDGTLRALVLSGGGAGGAFGAGALVGLSRRQERPQYDVVTGVSTGALIAPFAFLDQRSLDGAQVYVMINGQSASLHFQPHRLGRAGAAILTDSLKGDLL